MQLLNFALRIENVYRKEKKITDQMSNEFINKPFLKALFFFFFYTRSRSRKCNLYLFQGMNRFL